MRTAKAKAAAFSTVAAFIAVVIFAPTIVSATATSRVVAPHAVRLDSAPVIPPQASASGAVPNIQLVHFDVALQPRDPAALTAFANAVSTPGSPQFHQYLSTSELASTYGASPATISSVEQTLNNDGLFPDAPSSDGLSIPSPVRPLPSSKRFQQDYATTTSPTEQLHSQTRVLR